MSLRSKTVLKVKGVLIGKVYLIPVSVCQWEIICWTKDCRFSHFISIIASSHLTSLNVGPFKSWPARSVVLGNWWFKSVTQSHNSLFPHNPILAHSVLSSSKCSFFQSVWRDAVRKSRRSCNLEVCASTLESIKVIAASSSKSFK